jgi:c-di-AMP phosphodiesterase-like protein
MNLNNFYILVNTETKQTIGKIQKLPENWKNISGLPGLSDEELCDLKWAGHHNLGWINIFSKFIKEYSSHEENFKLNKDVLKQLISEIKKEKQLESIEYHGAKFKLNIKTWNSLFLLKTKEKVNYKCINGYFTFTSSQLVEICDIIDQHIENLFNVEMEIFQQIDNCESISDFYNITFNF